MFCQYDELRGLCKGRFATFWLAGDKKPKKAKGRIQYNNADVVSACNALLGIARMRSPSFEWVSPELRLPTPRPKLTFSMMAIFLKGITVVHRYQSFALYDLCKVMVEELFNAMVEPAPIDYSLDEIDWNNSRPKKKGRSLAINSAKIDRKIDADVEMIDKTDPRKQKRKVVQNISVITMDESGYPRLQPDSFGDEILPTEKGYDLRELATLIETLETSCHGSGGLSQPTQDPQQKSNFMETVREKPISKIPDQGAPEQKTGPVKRSHPDEDSMNTASISLLSVPPQNRKKRSAPVQPRRRLPMKIFIKSFSQIANYRYDKTYLRKLKASEFWEEGMAAFPLKTAKELGNTPLLPIYHMLSYNLFSLRTDIHSKDLHRRKRKTVDPESPQSKKIRLSNGSGPSGGHQLGLAAPSPSAGPVNLSTGLRYPTLEEEPMVEQSGLASQEQNVRGHSDIVQDDAPSRQVLKRLDTLEEEPAKLSHSNLLASVVSKGRLWDRASLREKISHLWATQGSPITFYDICPETVTSIKTAAKVLSALLNLHLEMVLILEQENVILCTPILINQPEALV